MRWVTWQNVGIDRMGCSWLIRKHIDKDAQFTFVPEATPLPKLPKDAEPFDIPGARFSHHGGHCSFFALLREQKIDDPILKKIALIIDEADTVQDVSLESSAPGLDLICRGIRLAAGDDETALKRGAMVYDALYAALSEKKE